ncbi:hypothetical protein TUSST3_15260 [Streptomyces sp. TUS-ST3]|nr:hypothetical protein TUSST3_15260 [Streptomyces sp. TUS-ST3]
MHPESQVSLSIMSAPAFGGDFPDARALTPFVHLGRHELPCPRQHLPGDLVAKMPSSRVASSTTGKLFAVAAERAGPGGALAQQVRSDTTPRGWSSYGYGGDAGLGQ